MVLTAKPRTPQVMPEEIMRELIKQDGSLILNEVAVNDKKGRLIARAKIEEYQKALQKNLGSESGEMDSINNNGLKEYFVNNSYVRELFIPKGVTIVSHIWKVERLWIIATGEVTFTTEMGTRRVKAPYTEVVPLGSKVALYAHEDTLWFAITGTKGKNTDEVKADVIADDYSGCNYPWLEIVK